MRAKRREGFGRRLAELRDDKGLRQEDLARELDVSVGSVSRWERGENLPHGDQIAEIVRFFDTTADFLVLGRETQPTARTPEFHKFLATEYGRIAQARGWLKFLASAEYPQKPTVKVYKELVHALVRAYDSDE